MSTEKTFDVLSTHKTIAEYVGTEHMPCMFRTALCPDRCGHAKDVAKFKIIEYKFYEKPGQYGDEKTDMFRVELHPKRVPTSQNPEIDEVLPKLKEGQKVELEWRHIYTSDAGSKYPERPVDKIAPIE